MATKARKRAVNDLRARLKSTLKDAAAGYGGDVNKNIVARRNVVISQNLGQEGSRHTAVAAQVAPIRQKGSESRTKGGG
jgi:hypothetical protein